MSLPIETLNLYLKDGLIRRQVHPTLPLCIFNYSEACQFTRAWDEITNQCRGLITDQDGIIVARSFDKFHNIEENRHQATDDYVVYEKYDGSLGILFHYENEWRVASRGSFVSEQAVKAKEMLDTKYNTERLDPQKSYIFEIIYPTNRIVVDYKGEEKLIYLASFLPTGEEFFEADLMISSGFPVVKVYDGYDYKTINKGLDWDNAEGFVVRFSNGSRCKIKLESYILLHKVITNLSVLGVWSWFKTGQPVVDFAKDVPDEWHGWLKETWEDFEQQKRGICAENAKMIETLTDVTERADFARAIKDYPYRAMLFAIRDGKDVHKLICDQIRPKNVQLGVSTPQIVRSSKKPVAQPEVRHGRIIMLSGVSASGKSTWAAEYVHKHPDAVIVSRDAIRLMLWGRNDRKYHEHPRITEREAKVTATQYSLIRQFLDRGDVVLIDDTNLSLSVINSLCKTFADYAIAFRRFQVTYEVAIQRDAQRSRNVGEVVIREQFEKLKILEKTFDFEDKRPLTPELIVPNPNGKAAYVYDIDGTLARNVTGRSPYDWGRVGEDEVKQNVKACALALSTQGYSIIVCTGRDACCFDITKKWLDDNGIPCEELHMRPEKDQRADWKVKEEMWRQICSTYNVQALFDDRQQVVDHGRRLGLEVFQVAVGAF